MEVKGEVQIRVKGKVAKLHYRGETEESYIEVDGSVLRETNPTQDAYRSFVLGLAQALIEEIKRNKEILTKIDRNGTYCS